MVDIKVSVTRGDDDAGRTERLKRVATQLRGERLSVLALHDHLDVLGINWRRRPYTGEVVRAMRICAEHGIDRADHYIRGRLLLSDTNCDASHPGNRL
jgi:hypothetical protein